MTIDSYQCHDLSMASSASLSPLVLASNSSSPQPGSPLVKSNGSPNSGTGNSSSSSNIGGSSSSSGGNGVSSGGKPRMVIDWTEWEAEILMTEYETHRCLWDPSHPNYHSNNERTQAYVKILEKLGQDKFNITDIKKKINSIRTQFNQERNRLMKMTAENGGGGRGGEVTAADTSRFKYYDRLSFLAESVDIRRNQRSITPKSSEDAQTNHSSSATVAIPPIAQQPPPTQHTPTTSSGPSNAVLACPDPPSGLDLLKNHQNAALTLANLGNPSLLNGSSPSSYPGSLVNGHQMSSPGRSSLSGLSASELSALIPPLLSSDLVSKLAEERSTLSSSHMTSPARIPNGIPLSISTTGSDDVLTMSRSYGDSGRTPNGSFLSGGSSVTKLHPVLLNGVDASSGSLGGSDHVTSRVPTIMYHGSANHIPISPVTAYPQQTFPNTSSNSLSLPIPNNSSSSSSISPSSAAIKMESNSANSSSNSTTSADLSSPSKSLSQSSKPTCAIIPEANKSRSVVAPQMNSSSQSTNATSLPLAGSTNQSSNSLRSMVPPRKRQKFANMHDMVTPNSSSTLHIPKNSTVNLQVNEARNKTEEFKQCGADESFGAYIAAEIKSIRNQSIKNKLKLQIISLIIQSSNDEILGFSGVYD